MVNIKTTDARFRQINFFNNCVVTNIPYSETIATSYNISALCYDYSGRVNSVFTTNINGFKFNTIITNCTLLSSHYTNFNNITANTIIVNNTLICDNEDASYETPFIENYNDKSSTIANIGFVSYIGYWYYQQLSAMYIGTANSTYGHVYIYDNSTTTSTTPSSVTGTQYAIVRSVTPQIKSKSTSKTTYYQNVGNNIKFNINASPIEYSGPNTHNDHNQYSVFCIGNVIKLSPNHKGLGFVCGGGLSQNRMLVLRDEYTQQILEVK